MATHREPEDEPGRFQDAVDLARGTGVNLLGNLGKLTRPVAFVFAGRVFGEEALGLFFLAWSVVDTVSKLAAFGLDVSIVRFVTRRRLQEDPESVYAALGHAFTIGLSASVAVTCLAVLVAPWISEAFFGKPDLAWPLAVLALSMPFLAASYILLGATKALRIMRFDLYVRNIVEPFAFLFGVLLSSLVWQDGRGLALAQALAFLMSAVAAGICFGRHFPFGRCLRGMSVGAFRSPLARLALPVSCYNVLNIFAARVDVLLLGYFLPSARVGIYGTAKEVALVIKKFRQACEPIFLPVVSEQIQGNQRERLRDTLATAAHWTLAVSLPFVGLLAVSGDAVLGLYGPAFAAGALAAVLLASGNLINSVFGFSEFILLMSGRPYLNLVNTIVVVLISGIGGVLLIPGYGILGPPLAILAAFGLVNAVRLVLVRVLVGVHPFRLDMVKPLVALLAAVGTTAVAHPWLPPGRTGTAAEITLFATVYTALVWAVGLGPAEREVLCRVRRRLGRRPSTAE